MLDILMDPKNPFIWIIITLIIILVIVIFSRSFSTNIKFVYPNAKFEAMGNPFILESELNKLIDIKDLKSFKEILNQTKDYKVSGNTTKEIQQSLDQAFIKNVFMMKKDSSKKMNPFFDIYLEKIDSYLIKTAIKSKIQDKIIDEEIIENASLLKTKNLLKQIIFSDKKDLKNILIKYGFNSNIVNIINEKDINFLKLDIEIDKYIFNKFKETKVPYKCENAKNKFLNILIDTNNIKNILRAKQLNYDSESIKQIFLGDGQEIAAWKYNNMANLESIPQIITSLKGTSYYESLKNAIEIFHKEKSIQIFENELDNNFLKLIKNISMENFVTIGPTIRFIVSKEFEIKNLKIIVKGIAEGLSSNLIKPYLIKEIKQ
ncbi:MAG: V-type ATPase subunit [Thermoplasmatota archaeon]